MGKAGQTTTVSATEFAELTGVSRERLRTWERRHRFPAPVRQADGARRRYALDDVPRVVAVRRAVDEGVPLPDAVAATDLPERQGISAATGVALAEHAPLAVVALSGPEPLRFEFVNAAVRARPGAPQPGDELLALAPAYADQAGCATLRRLFTDDVVAAACEHPDWTGGLRPGAHSIAYRLPQEPGSRPLVALIGVDTARERRTRQLLAQAERDLEELRGAVERDRRFSEAATAVADVLRLNGGAGALAEAVGVLVRRLGAVDAALAPYMAGSLVLGRSTRGLLGPEMVTVTRFGELAEAVRDVEQRWLGAGAADAFGAPSGLALLAVPVHAAGETLGVLLLLFDERGELTRAQARELRVVSAILGFALVRERLAGDTADASGP